MRIANTKTGTSERLGSPMAPKPLVNTQKVLLFTIGRSVFWKSPFVSPVDEMSSAPVRSRMALAFDVHSDLSECTESRMPPFFTRPS